ncbi:neuraminidase-like domain-containing protein [Photorhabdus hainanensis]|uniref:Tc toxin subunit A-related protein n=1 Tax=Photorhabdus hainanensis TaxID=1004166 RepID=UPI001BD4D6D4|nr:neuraminidase-like domain-containing protein [Photorhabdus hainanensis]MBS9434144.1 toxin [Photorhabdus hainanensis]
MNTLKPEYKQALGADFNNLTDISHLSFDELRKKVKDKLSWSQTQSLYLEAQQVQKDNLLHEARILKRANPQLQSAVHLALTTPHTDQQDYNSRFGNRASQYAAPGAISSMFSPAAYLAELYRQARNLHAEDSIYHLDKRRPDLKSLVLSQKNMDTEISTLSLSNKVLLEGLKTLPKPQSNPNMMETLSTFRPVGTLPYHDAYESIRKIIQLQAPVFEQLSIFPKTTLSQLKYQASLLDINASVSPGLLTILAEEITEATAETLYKNNFGDIKPSLIEKLEYLKSYYNLSDEESSDFIKIRAIFIPEEEIKITKPASNTTEKPDYLALLKLNKFIRLFKAINLSPTVLSGILRSISPEFNINKEVLKKIFRIKYYMQRYGIDAETALILCKAPISQHSNDGHLNQFDRLFNSPKLSGQDFSTNGAQKIDLNLNNTNGWSKTVLKRAFNVNDTSLNRLLKITNPVNTTGIITNDIENLSHLYRTKLLADIHQLTIHELGLLLAVINTIDKDKEKTNLSTISHTALATLIDKLYAVTHWLRTRKWNVHQLFVMTTTDYHKTLVPEIHNLLDTIYNGLQNFDKKKIKIKEELLKAISPYIAAALQLPSEHTAYSILAWADKLEPGTGKMTAEKLWNWLQENPVGAQSETTEPIQQAVQYCQCLAQLALIYRSTGLSESTLRLFVTNPQIFGLTAETTSTHNVLSLIMLTRFTDWVNSLGENASSVLTKFEKGILTAKSLPIDSLLQWINTPRQLNISLQGISELAQVLNIESSSDYAQWENVASILTAGLDTQKANALHTSLDESRSAAFSEYYIYMRNQVKKDLVIKDRDDLYQYLLIDNQVSAAIKTTEIAEAIASIQLYINRALKNMEGDVDTSVASRSFFTNWDKYNKRYSTWAGIAKFLYYPENYIDPTLRIGQTKMMDALLQSISQSQLNTDTVEDAFKSYLTSFEQVANLEVISAYHDNINNDQGLTYFIGRSKTEVNQYYWRSVDHNKFSEGKFPANAWSEWHKIDCPINPYEDTIRPVVYQSRLYIIWLEQKKMTKQEGDKTTSGFSYELKLAHIRYDGTWNTPVTFDVNNKISTLNPEAKSKSLGLYCASYQGKDKLLVIFYQKLPEQADYKPAAMQGLYISSNMSQEEMAPDNYKTNIYKQLDTRTANSSVIRVNNRYAESYEIPSSVNNNNGYDWGEDYLSMVYGGNILITRPEPKGSKIQISPKLRIIHNGYEGRQRNQCNLIKKYGKLGDKFIIYTTLGINPNNSSNQKFIYPVYQYEGNESKLSQGRLLFYRDSATNFARAWLPSSGSQPAREISTASNGGNINGNDGYITNSLNTSDPFKQYFYMDDHGGIDTDISGPMFINTKIQPSNVKVIIKATGIDGKTFIASENKNVPTEPTPNFEEMYYQFKVLEEIDVSKLTYNNNEASIDITFTAFADAFDESGKKRNLGEEHFSIRIIKKAETDDVLSLHSCSSGAQYMQWGDYRTRLNTLFARKLISRANAGIDTILSMETQNIQEPKLAESSSDAMEPMDFNGANSLYFWELFYYTPMLIAQRLLHEQNFDEANRWLKYVWNPSGHIANGQKQHPHNWNVRPLQEDTSWNDDPLDTFDPDAIAQHDPMHYKVATFMRAIDLLIEQGDYAYRQLERDTLAEAKMWYMQALHLLGDKPHLLLSSTWSDPELKEAADLEKQQAHAKAIADLRQGQPKDGSNTDLFLPQVNEVMLSYWQKLEQRLYNLRHNLSIDGQPLHLPIFATPVDPKALLSAAVASSQGGSNLPSEFISVWRFPHMLENARSMVSQLTQFGSTLQNIIERQDAEALNTLLQNQAAELILTNLSIQDKTIEELDVEKTVLEKTRAGAKSRFDSYSKFYDEDINAGEKQAMALRASVAGLSTALQASHLAGAALDLAPNIFGFADGGSHWGAIAQATGNVMEFSASVMNTEADKISQSEAYRRRRQEWEIQRNNAEAELKQIDAQLGSLAVRREAAVLQKTSLKTQQEQTHAQLTFLQHKFSNQALYNWLRGRLSAIYFQFYDLTVARCLMAEMAYRWETNDAAARFIKPGAWQGTHAGLLAGETLMLNLAQMEDAHLKQEQRILEVERTVSLAEVYNGLPKKKGQFSLTEKIAELVKNKSGTAGSGSNTLKLSTENAKASLQASISLADLQIRHDYPESSGVGNVRRIKQISVTLPALLGPYQDVQAILSYSGKASGLAESCKSLAVSHGMNDSGQFQLDFNDGKFLPFEGIDIDKGTLTLSFPNATGKQQAMLESLNDIILHIRYTIRQ